MQNSAWMPAAVRDVYKLRGLGYSEWIQQLISGRSTIEDIEAFLFNKASITCLIMDDFPTVLSLDRVFPHAIQKVLRCTTNQNGNG